MQINTGNEGFLPILPNPATHIRLLVLFACEEEDVVDIQISLISVPFLDAPAYHAVSYTWGDHSSEEDITICNSDNGDSKDRSNNCRRMTVRKSCANVLRQLAHFKTAKYYWVDAICIDQINDTEKSYQVAMMGEIFSRADCVLSCVGMHKDDSKFMANTLRSFDTYLASHGKSAAVFSSRSRKWTDEKGWTIWHSERWLEALADEDVVRLYEALDAFARRPYFWRIWILQELFVARHIVILCDLDELSLPTIFFWWVEAKSQWFFRHRDDIAAGQEPPILMRKLTALEAGKDYLGRARWNDALSFYDDGGSGLGAEFEDMLRERAVTQTSERQKLSLSKLLNICEQRYCQDPRDTVYGTLSLANWGDGMTFTLDGAGIRAVGNVDGVLRLDYTKSSYSLAKEVMLNFREMDELVKLVIFMLLVGPDVEEVISGIDSRRQSTVTTAQIEDQDLVHLANQPEQEQLQIVEGGFQITSESVWRIERATDSAYVYIHAVDRSDNCRALASATIHVNDWIVPTTYSYGFILRQVSEASKYFQIVGKVWFPPELLPDDLEMTAFMMWLGVDDILVHLAGGLASTLLEDDTNGPGQRVLELINDNFCGEPYSSCAEIPGEKRTSTADNFLKHAKALTFQLLADWHLSIAKESEGT
ncbi:heterokaryon incompatibility protein-domain-containing protein [Paraphoma chrysanthemicola]|uniref:Heterokaryon incompatibility protein-domain-containing protein n=1 Tax=Paraphoma chrysanthemicola TaxID=798071 RepID=A0A8K0R8Z1_9PLEO|nr:heterokaryon incompatibility protein-domain-containing protein [Paraphoma chrysanthemicola]